MFENTVIAAFVEGALDADAHFTQGQLQSLPVATRHITNGQTSPCSRVLDIPVTQE